MFVTIPSFLRFRFVQKINKGGSCQVPSPRPTGARELNVRVGTP
jgi:hypothetical protein